MRKIMVSIMLFILMPMAYAWYDVNFKYQKCFDLINIPNLTYTNYIMKVDISSITKAKPDYSDLIVVYNDTKIPRFIANGYLYFPIDLNPSETKTYCLYYGNPSYNEYNNITIFKYSDDFEYRYRLNWTGTCTITNEDKYTGFYSVRCDNGQYISVSGIGGNEYSFAYKGTFTGYTASTSWVFYTGTLTGNSITFTSGKGTNYLDTFIVRNKTAEPSIYWYVEKVYGYSIQYIKSYCEDSYLSTDVLICIYENCTLNKTSTYCEYGCYQGKCIESPFTRSFKLIGLAIFIMILFWIVWRVTR